MASGIKYITLVEEDKNGQITLKSNSRKGVAEITCDNEISYFRTEIKDPFNSIINVVNNGATNIAIFYSKRINNTSYYYKKIKRNIITPGGKYRIMPSRNRINIESTSGKDSGGLCSATLSGIGNVLISTYPAYNITVKTSKPS